MNYLAHISLSGKDEKIIIGNFIGDFVKGNSYENYEQTIRKGILLHRFIDDFTDTHPKVKTDVKLISEKIGRYAPVAIDVFYDYLLCKNWSEFYSDPVKGISDNFYSVISENRIVLPEKCQFMFRYMKRDDWLSNYKSKSGVEQTLKGISRRTKFNSKLDIVTPYLLDNEESINRDFVSFYLELMENSKLFLNGKA